MQQQKPNISGADADHAGSAAPPMQMPLPPVPASSHATGMSPLCAANSGQHEVAADEGTDRDGDGIEPAPELQTPPKNGKRRRGGRVRPFFFAVCCPCSRLVLYESVPYGA